MCQVYHSTPKQGLASYTWSHSIDIASTDAFANYLNTPGFIGNPDIDRGASDFDEWNKFADAVLGDWSLDTFVYARSAPPVDVIGGYSFVAGTALRYRPNVVPDVPLVLYGSQNPGGKIYNSKAFTNPPTGQQGDFGRNVLRAFGATQLDFAVQRQYSSSIEIGLTSLFPARNAWP